MGEGGFETIRAFGGFDLPAAEGTKAVEHEIDLGMANHVVPRALLEKVTLELAQRGGDPARGEVRLRSH